MGRGDRGVDAFKEELNRDMISKGSMEWGFRDLHHIRRLPCLRYLWIKYEDEGDYAFSEARTQRYGHRRSDTNLYDS